MRSVPGILIYASALTMSMCTSAAADQNTEKRPPVAIVVQAGHPVGLITAAATFPNSSRYVTAGQDGTVRVVEQDGTIYRTTQVCDYWIHAIEFLSPRRLAAACGDHVIYVIDALSGEQILAFPTEATVRDLSGYIDRLKRELTTQSRERRPTSSVPAPPVLGRPSGFGTERGGSVAIPPRNIRGESFSVQTRGRQPQTYRVAPRATRIDSLHWLNNGILTLGMEDGRVQLWSTASGVPIQSLEVHNGPIHSIVALDSGKTILSGGFDDAVMQYAFRSDNSAEIWHVKPDDRAQFVERSEWDRILYAAREDIVPVRRPRAPFGLAVDNDRPNTDDLYRLSFSQDGRYIFASGRGVAHLYDRQTSAATPLLPADDLGTAEIEGGAFSRDGRVIAVLHGSRVSVFELPQRRMIRQMSTDARMRAITITDDEDPRIVVGASDGTITTWTTRDWAQRSYRTDLSVSRLTYWAAQNAMIVAGSSSEIEVMPLNGRPAWKLGGHSSSISALALHPSRPILAASGRDGSVIFWNLQTRELLATLATASMSDWIVADQDGFFDGPAASWQRVRFRVGETLFSPEQLAKQYWEPGLLQQVLAEERPFREILASRGGTNRLSDLSALLASRAPELRVTIKSPAGQRNQTVSVRVSDRQSGAVDLRVFRNGTLVHKVDGPLSKSVDVNVVMLAGNNDVTAYAFSKEGVRSRIAKTSARGPAQSPVTPTLRLLAIGVNSYDQQPLDHAVADARVVADAFETHYPATSAISKNILENERATRSEIASHFSRMAAEAQPEDVVVIFFAGHGVRIDGQLHLLPVDYSVDSSAPTSPRTISDADLYDWLSPIAAFRTLLIIDACHAGQALESEDSRWGPLNSRGLGQLAFEKGIYVVGASQGYQSALENSKLGHGLLTYALIKEGLEMMLADQLPTDNRLFAEELLAFVGPRVKELQVEFARRRGVLPVPSQGPDSSDDALLQEPRIYYPPEFEQNPLLVRERN